MSVVISIRDYIDIINTQIGPRLGDDSLSIFSRIFENIPHIIKVFKDTLLYLLSFKGLRDNFYQPYLTGIDLFKFSPFTGLEITADIGSFEPEIGNFFLTGLGNSFFISLPGSIGTLLVLRRLITQGTYAGIAATLGGVFGNCSTVVCVIVGTRGLVLNAAFLDLFFYLGLLIPVGVILRGLCFSDFRIIPSKDTFSLISIGLMHFLLGVSNQSTLFRHIRDLTVVPYPNRFFGISNLSSGVVYILGFSVGSFIFAFSAFYGVLVLINWWLAQSTITRSRLMKWSENLSIVFLTCLSISTLSFYGTDFLLTKGFGFLPSDKGFSETILAPNSLFKDPHNLTGIHALYPGNEFSLDPAPFDRPLDKLFRRSILLKQQGFKYRSFEELNYQGEKHWLHRGFRHGSAKPIKTASLSAEKNKLSEGRALLRSLDKAIGWDTEIDPNKKAENQSNYVFTNLALEEIPFNFEKVNLLGSTESNFTASSKSTKLNDIDLLEQKFKRLFYGQIGLLPGRLPPSTYGPFDSQEMAHKRLAFANPVYKALLSFDIDLFLQRQPTNQSLSAEDEHNIYLKRQLLERYINTQRDYFFKTSTRDVLTQTKEFNKKFNFSNNLNSVPINNILTSTKELDTINHADKSFDEKTFIKNSNNTTNHEQLYQMNTWEPILEHKEQFFTKSVANQTYKHQFKGTLEIVRQMFAVSLDCPEPSSVAGGGAWDKVVKINGEVTNFFKDDKGLVIARPKNPRILKFDQPLYSRVRGNTQESTIIKKLVPDSFVDSSKDLKLSESLISLSHEELYNYLNKNTTFLSETRQTEKPFLESVSISPFYVGWDNERRQLLLTQRYLSRKDALVFYPQKNRLNVLSETPKLNSTNTKNRYESTEKAQPSLPFESLKGKENNPGDNSISFATWPVVRADPTDKGTTKLRIPSRLFEHMIALEEEARLGLEEPSDKNKGLRGSYEGFADFWTKNFTDNLTQEVPSFTVSRWPVNITTPEVQADLDNFDQIENSLFTAVKRGGFIWPGTSSTSSEFKLKKN